MPGVKTRRSASKHAFMTSIAVVTLAAAASTFWTVPARTDNASVTGHEGDLINRPGCWSESGYDGQVPCAAVRGAPGLRPL